MPYYQYARNICEHLKTKVIHFVFLKYIFFLIITFTYRPGYQMNQYMRSVYSDKNEY